MNKGIGSSGKWEDLRKTINFTKKEEIKMEQEKAIIQKIIDTRKSKK